MLNIHIKMTELSNIAIFKEQTDCKNYLQFLVDNAQPSTEPGCQVHHIIPRAYYKQNNMAIDNNDTNLVRLHYADHIKAHYFLALHTIDTMAAANLKAVRSMLHWIGRDDLKKKQLSEADYKDLQALYEKLELGLTYDRLYNYLIIDGHTKKEACDFFGCSKSYFRAKLKKYNIVIPNYYTPSKAELIQYYKNENHTLTETASHFGCCTAKLIVLNKKYGICKHEQLYLKMNEKDVYDFFVNQNHNKYETAAHFNIPVDKMVTFLANHNITKKQYFDNIKNELTADYLYELYVKQNWSRVDIARKYNCSEAFIKKLLIKHKITKGKIQINE